MAHVTSYTKDSIDFLNKCKRETSENAILVTFNFCIPHTLGIEAIKYFLEEHPASIDSRFKSDFVIEGIHFIVKNITFTFNGENYLQLVGTAMATIFAPTYATLVVGYLEKKLYSIIEVKYGEQQRKNFEENWYRFFDDCSMVLEAIVKPNDLLEILNGINPAIQITMEESDKTLPFLDINVNKNDKMLWMNIYSKPTDAKRFSSFSSCHPNHCLKNILYCLARRMCMIVENKSQRDFKFNELK